MSARSVGTPSAMSDFLADPKAIGWDTFAEARLCISAIRGTMHETVDVTTGVRIAATTKAADGVVALRVCPTNITRDVKQTFACA